MVSIFNGGVPVTLRFKRRFDGLTPSMLTAIAPADTVLGHASSYSSDNVIVGWPALSSKCIYYVCGNKRSAFKALLFQFR